MTSMEGKERFAVVGLGLLGGSLALRLKERCPAIRILGLARRDATRAVADVCEECVA